MTDDAVGVLKLVPVMVTDGSAHTDAGATPVTAGVTAHAGSAVASTPTTPSTSANAVARADTFLFWNLTEVLLSGVGNDRGQTRPVYPSSVRHEEWSSPWMAPLAR